MTSQCRLKISIILASSILPEPRLIAELFITGQSLVLFIYISRLSDSIHLLVNQNLIFGSK
jgi:hypothetical protein